MSLARERSPAQSTANTLCIDCLRQALHIESGQCRIQASRCRNCAGCARRVGLLVISVFGVGMVSRVTDANKLGQLIHERFLDTVL